MELMRHQRNDVANVNFKFMQRVCQSEPTHGGLKP